MWVTPYKFNGDRNAIPIEGLNVKVKDGEIGRDPAPYVARVEDFDVEIAYFGDTPEECVQVLLCFLEQLGFEGEVRVWAPGYPTSTVTLGKTEAFAEMFGEDAEHDPRSAASDVIGDVIDGINMQVESEQDRLKDASTDRERVYIEKRIEMLKEILESQSLALP